MKKLLSVVAACVSLAGCAAVPLKVQQRRHATGIIKSCRGPNMSFGVKNWYRSPWVDQQCVARSNEYCDSVGLEKNCGVDGMW